MREIINRFKAVLGLNDLYTVHFLASALAFTITGFLFSGLVIFLVLGLQGNKSHLLVAAACAFLMSGVLLVHLYMDELFRRFLDATRVNRAFLDPIMNPITAPGNIILATSPDVAATSIEIPKPVAGVSAVS